MSAEGFDQSMSHLQAGVEVVIEDGLHWNTGHLLFWICLGQDYMQYPNGHFQVSVVGTRVFHILEAGGALWMLLS